MIRIFFIITALVLFLLILFPFVTNYQFLEKLPETSAEYAENGPKDVGAQNIVTSVIVTYRGLDTLGEVTVLFIAACGIAYILKKREFKIEYKKRDASEILKTGSGFLFPLILIFGTYVIIHGHLTPGGGFQGGVIIASGFLLLMLSNINFRFNKGILKAIESLSGAFYVGLAVLGIFLASGFLDNKFLPLGSYGRLLSAGAIPLIYTFIGIKVGAEISGILSNMKTGRNR